MLFTMSIIFLFAIGLVLVLVGGFRTNQTMLRIGVVGLSSLPFLFITYLLAALVTQSLLEEEILTFELLQIVILICFFMFAGVSYAVASAAEAKGRNWLVFYWLSLLISPLLMGIIVATLSANSKPRPTEEQADQRIGSLTELEAAHALLMKGALSEDEFAQIKKKLLGDD